MDGRLRCRVTLDNADYINEFYFSWTATIVRSGPGQAFCRGASLELDELV
jgi:hypothetical protein